MMGQSAAMDHDTGTDAARPATPAMNREFIIRNQIVERYLAGHLPVRGAQDFERFCRQHPELLEEIGLADRLNAGLRLLDSGGLASPLEQPKVRFWQKPALLYGLIVLAAVTALIALVLFSKLTTAHTQISRLQQRVQTQPLEAATGTTSLVLMPSRTAPSRRAVASFGSGSAEIADLKIDMSWSKFTTFRVTIDRIDEGRVGIIYQALKDSNGHVHLGLNTSALGPGLYQVTLEGLDWRGDASAQAWLTVELAHQFNAARGG